MFAMGWLAPIVILAVLTASQPAPPEEEIRRLSREASDAFDRGDFTAALAGYELVERRLDALPSRQAELGFVLYLAATTLIELGREEEALLRLDRAQGLPLSPEVRAEVDARRAEAAHRLHGRLVLRCEWPYAEVTVEGQGEPRPCAEARRLPPGRHRLRVSQPEGEPAVREVEVLPKATVELLIPRSVVRKDSVPPPPAQPSRLLPALGLALAVGLAAGGAAALLAADVQASRAEEAYARAADPALGVEPRRAAMQETLDRDRAADQARAAGLGLAGGALAAGALSLVLWWD